jgi:hypothetical protein
MNSIMLCLAVATLGVDVGWQRMPDGGMEYIIEIEPQTLDAIRSQQEPSISSDVPRTVGDVRRWRIVMGPGKDPLPRDTPSAPAKPHPEAKEPPLLSTLPTKLPEATSPAETDSNQGKDLQPGRKNGLNTLPDPLIEATKTPPADEAKRSAASPVETAPITFDPSSSAASTTAAESSQQPPGSETPSLPPDVKTNMKPAIGNSGTDGQGDAPAKPWLPLTCTLFGLFASLGGNVFLGWIVWDLRTRFRALLNQQI